MLNSKKDEKKIKYYKIIIPGMEIENNSITMKRKELTISSNNYQRVSVPKETQMLFLWITIRDTNENEDLSI